MSSFAVPHPRPAEGQSPWQMLVTQLDGPQPLDEESAPDSGRHWNATPQAKFERLLRETGIPVGLLCNSSALRLVYGAWAQLLTLFRLVYEGGQHGAFQLPARKGYLFDPDRYPFLEGRRGEERHGIPRISDGVVFRVLQDLLILDGERLSYRALDVEQIGSVYETVMGFNLETAAGQSIAIRPASESYRITCSCCLSAPCFRERLFNRTPAPHGNPIVKPIQAIA